MRRTRIAIAATLVLTLAGACGGDDDADTDTETTEAPDVTDETDAPDGDEETTAPTTAAEVDEAADQAAAMAALEQFFTAYSAADFDGAAAVLENGTELQPTFQGLYDSFNVGDSALRADATEATIISDAEGEVVYDLYFGESPDPALPATSALMVKVDGEWKVAESTWNALLALSAQATTVA